MSSTTTNYIDRLEHELLGAIGRRRRKRTVVTRLAAMTAVTTAVGALLLTGNGSSPALAIDIRGRPPANSDVVLFVVSSPTPSFSRLTALGDFNGTKWTQTHGETGDVSAAVPQVCETGVRGETVTQTFEIRSLRGALLPAAFAPVRVDGPDGITLDAETSNVTASETSAGLRYTVESVLSEYGPDCLRAADASPPTPIAERYLALPADFPADLADQARVITAGASTRYDRAIALQSWFRGFTYDRSFRGHSQNVMREFLARRSGYCEQFAGTFAAFARVVGLPSRVAVGFTQGEQRDDGRFYVQGKHAHAWPEIYFDGVGWVPFEPTPGRSNPAAEQYTGTEFGI